MSTDFALDLRASRRKAGYTQGDIAHLLNHHQSHVSDLEHGHQRPTLEQIVTLSLIYGRSFESLFGEVMAECKQHLSTRLASLPPPSNRIAGTFNRESSLQKLKHRVSDNSSGHGWA